MARIVVSGGGGFLGSHLADALLARGDEVVVLDNLVTGSVVVPEPVHVAVVAQLGQDRTGRHPR